MKSFSDEAVEALARGDAIVSGAVTIHCDPPIRVWGGYGQISIDGETFEGIGDRGLAQVSGGAVGGGAQGTTLTLSALEPEVLELLNADEVRAAPTVLRRLIFESTGKTLLGAHVYERGRLDQLPTEEVIGGPAKITAMIETAARGLGRSGGRMRTDADQRLIKPNDGFFRNVAFAAEKQLYWGGPKPARAGTVLNGGTVKIIPGNPNDEERY